MEVYQKVARAEKEDDTPPDFDRIDSKTIIQTIDNLDATLKDIEDRDGAGS